MFSLLNDWNLTKAPHESAEEGHSIDNTAHCPPSPLVVYPPTPISERTGYVAGRQTRRREKRDKLDLVKCDRCRRDKKKVSSHRGNSQSVDCRDLTWRLTMSSANLYPVYGRQSARAALRKISHALREFESHANVEDP